jgi:FAD-dependent monooxygenase
MLPLEVDHNTIGSEEAAYKAIGGFEGSYEFKIDEILVRSAYRHSIAVARRYRSTKGNVFLAGDSAHQNIPTGGYGMNMVGGTGVSTLNTDTKASRVLVTPLISAGNLLL